MRGNRIFWRVFVQHAWHNVSMTFREPNVVSDASTELRAEMAI